MPTVSKREEPKQVMVIPSWENLCAEAGNVVGTGNALESFFTEAELKANTQEIRMLNAEYNQFHRLDKYDISISAAAGLLGAAIDILLVGIPKKTPEGLKGIHSQIISGIGLIRDFQRKRWKNWLTQKSARCRMMHKTIEIPLYT